MLETSWINFFFFIFILLCFFRRIYITITVLIFLLLSIVILIIWRKFLYHICVSMIWVIEILRKNSWFMFSIHSSFGISWLHININNIQFVCYLDTSSLFLFFFIFQLRIIINIFLRLNIPIWTSQSWLIFHFLLPFSLFLKIIIESFFNLFW